MTAGTLRQHVVAAEAIARGDLLFALYSGDLPPAEDDQLWLLPDGNEPEAVAVDLAARGGRDHAPARPACAAARTCSAPTRSTPGRSTASPACTCGRTATSTGRLAAGEHLHARRRARVGSPRGHAARRATAPLPADDDLLPALTDSAFALLVGRLEEALRG